jgi:hypothetical protein
MYACANDRQLLTPPACSHTANEEIAPRLYFISGAASLSPTGFMSPGDRGGLLGQRRTVFLSRGTASGHSIGAALAASGHCLGAAATRSLRELESRAPARMR